MGAQMPLQLREHNLMTKIMLKKQTQIIGHINESKLDLNQQINQTGDTIMHYAAYHSLKELLEYLLENQADCYRENHRGLTSVDVALPEVREWLIRRDQQVKEEKQLKRKDSSPASKTGNIIQSSILHSHTKHFPKT